jgi:hypothetical protein
MVDRPDFATMAQVEKADIPTRVAVNDLRVMAA